MTKWNNQLCNTAFRQRCFGVMQTLLLAGCLGLVLMMVPCLVPGATEARAQAASCVRQPGPVITRQITLRSSGANMLGVVGSLPASDLVWKIEYDDINKDGCLDGNEILNAAVFPPPGRFGEYDRIGLIPGIPGVSRQSRIHSIPVCPFGNQPDPNEDCNRRGVWVFYDDDTDHANLINRRFVGTTVMPVTDGYIARPDITSPADNSLVGRGVPFEITVRFDRPVTDFDDITDVRVSPAGGATVMAPRAVPGGGGGQEYTVVITPDTSLSPGSRLFITIPGGSDPDAAALDLSGLNHNAALGSPLRLTVDSAPRIRSLVRQTPPRYNVLYEVHNAITWRVVFSRPVQNVDGNDFTLAGASGTVMTVTPQGNNGDTYDVRATGGDLDSVTGIVTLGLADTNDIADRDMPGNALEGGFPPGAEDSFFIDNPIFEIESYLQNPGVSPTNADTLSWELLIVPAAENVDGSDFIVTGATGTTVTVTETLPGVFFNVTVSGGDLASLSGTVTLGLADDNDIGLPDVNPFLPGLQIPSVPRSVLDNTSFTEFSERSYVLDNTPPRISLLRRHNPVTLPTSADVLVWRMVFSEPVENVDSSDFRVTGAVGTNLRVTQRSSNGVIYDVTVSGGDLVDLNGTVTLELVTPNGIVDLVGNAFDNRLPSGAEDYLVLDDTPPRISSLMRLNPASSLTNADELVWRVVFSRPVQNVDYRDFRVTGAAGTYTGVALHGNNGDTYDVTVGGGNLASLNGRVTLELVTPHGITDPDTTSNTLDDTAFPPGAEDYYDLDNTPPRISSLVHHSPSTSPTAADVLVWRMVFSRPVQNVDGGDFTITGANGTGVAVTPQGSNGDTYEITVSGGDLADLNDTVTLGLATGNNIMDMVGNALADGFPSGSSDHYILHNMAPRISSLVHHSPSTSPTAADVLVWRMVFSRPVQNVDGGDFTITGANGTGVAVTPQGSNGDTYEITVSGGDLADLNDTVTLGLAVGNNIVDLAGNALADGFPPDAEDSYIVDNMVPRISSLLRLSPATSPTAADMLTWRLVFSETVENVDASDFSLSGVNSPDVTVTQDSSNSNAWDITVSGGDLADLNDTVTLGLAAGNDIMDSLGNALADGFPADAEDSYILDNMAPRISSLMRQNPVISPTAADMLVWRVMFSIPVQNVDSNDFTITGANGTNLVVTPQGNDTYDVTVLGGDLADFNGIVRLELADANDIADPLDVSLVDGFPPNAEDSYVLDNPVGMVGGVPPALGSESITITVLSRDAGAVRFTSVALALDREVILRNGSGTTGPVSVPPGEYAIDYTLPAGFAPLNAACSSDDAATTGAVDKAARRISITVAPGGALECQFVIEDVASRTVRQIRQFMDDRANIIMAHRPSQGRRIDRLKDQAGVSGLSVAGQQMLPALPVPLNIAIGDPNQDVWEVSMDYSCTQDSKSGFCHEGIWLEGTFGGYSSGETGGYFSIVHAGVERLTRKNLLMGMAAQFDRVVRRGRENRDVAKARSVGWMVGPYTTAQLDERLYLDASVKAGTAVNHITMPGYGFTDRFGSKRLSADTALFGDFDTGQFNTRPKMGLVWFRETSESWRNGQGVRIPEVEVSRDDLELGLRVTHTLPDGTSSQYMEADSYLPLDGDGDDERYAFSLGANVPDRQDGRIGFDLSFDTLGTGDWYAWSLSLDYQLPVTQRFDDTLDVGLSFNGENRDNSKNGNAAIKFKYTFPF